jgi:hypothetical protein
VVLMVHVLIVGREYCNDDMCNAFYLIFLFKRRKITRTRSGQLKETCVVA